MFINSTEAFSQWFNRKYPGAPRRITAEDIEEMAHCGLICRYQYYSTSQDRETIRAILEYEKLRLNRLKREEIRDNDGAIHCRQCGVVLPPEPDGKRGRRHEFCDRCERFRGRERSRKWRERQVGVMGVH